MNEPTAPFLSNNVNPLVSICIPTYNGSRYLTETLDSCVNQTYKNFEIVICDDGSTDDTLDIIQRYKAQYSNIHLHINEKNQGLVGNWKRCIEKANGDWIKFIFQDDILQPDCVERMLKSCLDLNTRVAICARRFIFEPNADERIKAYYTNELSRAEKLFTGKTRFEPEESARLLPPFVIENVLGEPICTLFHKSIYEQTGGYNEQLRQIVDYEFALRVVLTNPFCMIHEELAQFRVHGESTTGTTHAGSAEKNKVSEKMIQSTVGDFLRLLFIYSNDPRFKCFVDFWGKDKLELLERYLFLRACKYLGARKVKTALKDVIQQNDSLKKGRYHLLLYKWTKQRYKKQVKPLMNKYQPLSIPKI